MKNLKLALIVVAAAALLQTQADAGKGVTNQVARKAKAPAATVWGVCSGSLSGSLFVGSETVVIQPTTLIMDTRGNKLEPGATIGKRSVMVSGRKVDGKFVADMVAVGEPVSEKDFSEMTLPDMTADPNRAR